jgi:hypothetical protein
VGLARNGNAGEAGVAVSAFLALLSEQRASFRALAAKNLLPDIIHPTLRAMTGAEVCNEDGYLIVHHDE